MGPGSGRFGDLGRLACLVYNRGQGRRAGRRPAGGRAVGRDRHAWYLVPALPRSVGLGPVSSPPRLARTEQLSSTTSQGAISGPERTIRIRATWTPGATELWRSSRPGDGARW